MKEAIGGNFLFMIVIFFVILFAGYMCLSINHTKAFNVKNSLVRIVERNGSGLSNVAEISENSAFRDEIRQELAEVGYRTTGECNPGWTGFNGDGVPATGDALFCLRRVDSSSSHLGAPMYYYQVMTFYHLEIPILKSIFNLSIKGDTKPMI